MGETLYSDYGNYAFCTAATATWQQRTSTVYALTTWLFTLPWGRIVVEWIHYRIISGKADGFAGANCTNTVSRLIAESRLLQNMPTRLQSQSLLNNRRYQIHPGTGGLVYGAVIAAVTGAEFPILLTAISWKLYGVPELRLTMSAPVVVGANVLLIAVPA